VENSNWEHDRTSYEEAPQAFRKASKDVREPRKQAGQTNNPTHYFTR
jgi:hypothetical protein